MKLSGPWLEDAATQGLFRAFAAEGRQLLFVGGCVRNAVMGEDVGDIDLATDARPEEVIEIARRAKLRAVPTGIEHGTVTVIAAAVPHEITTFRRDVETDGRHAVVAYSEDLAEDARRRDFTMNALYAEADGTLVDPLGGVSDAQARRVRFIEDPVQRIREDYLRILRFFRFHARYGDPAEGPDPEGLAACAAEIEGLDGLSRERVGAELLKLLSAPDPAPAMAAFAAIGGLTRVLAGADVRALPVLVHLEAAQGLPPEPLRRLALIDAAGVASCLRLSRQQVRRIRETKQAVGLRPVAAAWRFGAEVAMDAALIEAALMETDLPARTASEIDRGAAAKLPVSAADLPDLQGPALGKRLKELENRWLASDLTLTRDELLA